MSFMLYDSLPPNKKFDIFIETIEFNEFVKRSIKNE